VGGEEWEDYEGVRKRRRKPRLGEIGKKRGPYLSSFQGSYTFLGGGVDIKRGKQVEREKGRKGGDEKRYYGKRNKRTHSVRTSAEVRKRWNETEDTSRSGPLDYEKVHTPRATRGGTMGEKSKEGNRRTRRLVKTGMKDSQLQSSQRTY